MVVTFPTYPHAIIAMAPRVSPILGSAMCFATFGFATGMSAYAWSCWTATRVNVASETDLDDDHRQEPGAGTAWTPDDTPRPARAAATGSRGVLRVLPVGMVSVGSLVGAAVVAPSQAAIALLAVGLLGLALIPILRNHERRLAALERRFRLPKPD
jgi:hypothetical protein